MKIVLFIYIFLSIVQIIISNAIFPSVKSEQEINCLKNTIYNLKSCTDIKATESQYRCCFLKGKNFEKCGYVENTEFGIKAYGHIYSDIEDLNIECKSNKIKAFFFLYIFLFILYL